MAFTTGADPEALDASTGRFRQYAAELLEIDRATSGVALVLAPNWSGDDQGASMAIFRTKVGPSCRQASATLAGLAEKLTQNAADQRRASGSGGGGTTGGGSRPGGSGGGPSGSGGGPGTPSWLTPDGQGPARTSYTPTGHTTEYAAKHGSTTTTLSVTDGPGQTRVGIDTTTTTGLLADGQTSRGSSYGETYLGNHKVAQDYGQGIGYQRDRGPQPQHAAPEGPDKVSDHASATYNLAHGQADVAVATVSDVGAHHEVMAAVGYAQAQGDAYSGYKDGILGVGASATAGAYLGYAQGKVMAGPAYAEGKAYAGAEANASGMVGVGPDGLQAHAGADAFVGGKAEAAAGVDTRYVDASAGVGVSYGVGIKATADASLSLDKVGVSADLGATLGIGIDITFDVSFSPKAVIDDVGHALDPSNWF